MPTQNAPCCQLRGLAVSSACLRDAMRRAHAFELPVGHARGELEHVLAGVLSAPAARDAADAASASRHHALRQLEDLHRTPSTKADDGSARARQPDSYAAALSAQTRLYEFGN